MFVLGYNDRTKFNNYTPTQFGFFQPSLIFKESFTVFGQYAQVLSQLIIKYFVVILSNLVFDNHLSTFNFVWLIDGVKHLVTDFVVKEDESVFCEVFANFESAIVNNVSIKCSAIESLVEK